MPLKQGKSLTNSLLVEVSPDVEGEDGEDEDSPAGEGASATSEFASVK